MEVSAEDILKEIKDILISRWTDRDGAIVPDASDIKLSNDAVKLNATILYADMRGSTFLVDTKTKEFAAEIYKIFLLSACRCIRNRGGEIISFDGDRVMGIFLGSSKNTSAVRAAMNISFILGKVNEEIDKVYTNSSHKIDFGVGIDTSNIFAARTGIRAYNDIVWMGKAANYAAKYSEMGRSPSNIIISTDVYENMHDSVKFTNNTNMWTSFYSGNKTLYKTTYHWSF